MNVNGKLYSLISQVADGDLADKLHDAARAAIEAARGGTHVLVTGTPAEGFLFIGPVTPNDPALEHYTDIDPKPDYWWYADLTPLDAAPAEQTWTFIGHWANDKIVVEWVEEGEVDDDREDTGQYPEGLWAAAASGPDIKTAQAAAIAEYEDALAEQSKP